MALQGLPWRPKPDEPALDEVPVRVSAESAVPRQDLPDAPRLRAPEIESRRVYIRRDTELKKYGYTDGCPGCIAAQTGGKAVPHSEACRRRIEEMMEAEEEGRERLTTTFLRRQMGREERAAAEKEATSKETKPPKKEEAAPTTAEKRDATTATASTDPAGSKHALEPPKQKKLAIDRPPQPPTSTSTALVVARPAVTRSASEMATEVQQRLVAEKRQSRGRESSKVQERKKKSRPKSQGQTHQEPWAWCSWWEKPPDGAEPGERSRSTR